MIFNCPLSTEKADRLVDVLALAHGARVVDVGCGTGEFLLRLIARYGAIGTGIDPDGKALQHCRDASAGRVPAGHLDLQQLDAAAFDWPEKPFDAAVCIGSVHAFGGFEPALRELAARVAPGGVILIGDIFWKQQPSAEYREVIGDEWPSPDTHYLAGLRRGEEAKLSLLYSVESSIDEWDHFEGTFAARGYRRAYALPTPEARGAALERTRRWQAAYMKWGRDVMGFGFYVFLKPPVSGS